MPRPKGSKSNPNRKPMAFKQRELERALKAAKRQNFSISSYTVDPHTGLITVKIGEPTSVVGEKNAWDEVLPKSG